MAAVFRFLRLCALLPVLALAVPAAAQEADPAAPATAADPTAALLEVLQDDAARAELIARLQALATPADDVVPLIAEEDAPAALSLGRRLAVVTQGAAEGAAQGAAALWASLQRAPDAFDNLGTREFEVLLAAFGDLLVVIVVTVALFILLRGVMIPVYRRMGARALAGGLGLKTLIFVGSGLLDAMIVVAAWAIGYAVMLLFFGNFGEIGIQQTLYLNAFLAVELAKTAARLIISPATSDLRPLRVSDRGARRLYRTLNVVVSLIGYGQLLIVPIVNTNASYAAGRSISALIAVLAILFAAGAILRFRRQVTAWLLVQTRVPEPPVEDPAVVAPAPDTAPITGQEVEQADGVEEAPGVIRPAPVAAPDPAAAPDPSPAAAPAPGPAQVQAPAPRRRWAHRREGAFEIVAANWHWLALAWLGVMLVIVLTRPAGVLFGALWGSARVALALVLGLVLSGILGRAIARGVHLPQNISTRLPLLETRLNRFVPHALFVLRILIVIAVALFAFDTVDLIDVRGWLETRVGLRLTATLISVAAILLVAFLIWIALTSWVDYRLNPEVGSVATSREQTLLTLLRNAATIALIIVTAMFCLAEIGLNIGPLLASAGVLGLAIGFGAQKMVEDIITGIFIQFENAMNVGDVVTAGPTTGVVERLTVRSVSLRDLQGIYHVVPFSAVSAVSNFTRDFSFYLVDMGIAYREDTAEAKQALFDAFDELRQNPDHAAVITADLEWFGLDSFGDSAVVLRCRIKTLPGKQWGVGRAYNEIVKRIFDQRGIEIPFPHQTVYFGQSKDGRTQSLRIAETQLAAPEAD